MTAFRSIEWREGALLMIVRGAPAIGVAAAYGLALAANASKAANGQQLLPELQAAAEVLRASRPTAVNLSWAIDRVLNKVSALESPDVESIRQAILREAHRIAEEDVRANKQIGYHALPLIPNPAKILHHCNTGGLATVE